MTGDEAANALQTVANGLQRAGFHEEAKAILALTDGSGGYTFVGNTVAYNPGGPTGTVAGSGGVLILFFQAKIN